MLLDILSFDELKKQAVYYSEEAFPIIMYATPVMLSLVGLEVLLSQWTNRKVYKGRDFLASAGIGIGNLVSNVIVKAAMFIIVLFCWNMSPWKNSWIGEGIINGENGWIQFALCLIALDFFRYWAHRLAHEQRWLWTSHVTHHSSEYYNFAVSFRLCWFEQVKLVFFLPVAFAGFDPITFFIVHQVAVLYQFWIHTEFIRRLPKPIEFFFTTPSHHRVHHAVNEKYIDKNYGSTLIIWDRIFGTFQAEEEQAVYGIKTPVNSFNPFFLVFHECMDIAKDMKWVRNFRDFWSVLFAPPGQTKLPARDKAESVNKAGSAAA